MFPNALVSFPNSTINQGQAMSRSMSLQRYFSFNYNGMAKTDCQLDKIQNHPGDKHICEGLFRLDMLRWEDPPSTSVAPFHGLGSWKKRKGQSQRAPAFGSACFLTMDAMKPDTSQLPPPCSAAMIGIALRLHQHESFLS